MNRLQEWLLEILWPLGDAVSPASVAGAVGSLKPVTDLAVFNSGGPRSRTREETVKASVFPIDGKVRCKLGARAIGDVWALFSGEQSLRDAAWDILGREGFSEPAEAFARLEGIPRERLHCRAVARHSQSGRVARASKNPLDFLRAALVLGKCRGGLFDPDAPVIWTENRLQQCLQLYEIRESFYD